MEFFFAIVASGICGANVKCTLLRSLLPDHKDVELAAAFMAST
jgi:hypothetical protein